MAIFKRKSKDILETEVAQSFNSPIEIVTNKHARQEVIKDAKKAQEHLNKLLVENGFTIKIFLAAGGNPPAQTKRRK